MSRGIVLGISAQLLSAVGYLFIVRVVAIKSELLRACLVICISAAVALVIVAYLILSGSERLSLNTRDVLYLALGSVLVMIVAQTVWFVGLSASSMTAMTYTMLAYPIIAMILELAIGRMKLSALTWRDLVGFGLLAVGYVVLISKKQ